MDGELLSTDKWASDNTLGSEIEGRLKGLGISGMSGVDMEAPS